MADEQRTVIQGRLIIRGIRYGAMQAIHVPDADPSDWEIVHFLTPEEMYQYASKHNLIVQEPNADQGTQR
jgi:hypothetical protein